MREKIKYYCIAKTYSQADSDICTVLALQLPEDADLSGITAAFRDGVLAVTVKRVQPAEPEVEDVPIDDWFDVSPTQEDKPASTDPFADDE